MKAVRDLDDLMISNRSGIVIRMSVNDLRVMGRATQGVRLIRLDENDSIADVAVIPYDPSESESTEESSELLDGDAPANPDASSEEE